MIVNNLYSVVGSLVKNSYYYLVSPEISVNKNQLVRSKPNLSVIGKHPANIYLF